MKDRYSGVDITKIVCMWMIVSIHALNHGGILNLLEPFTVEYYIVYSYYALTFVANNIFILISGYFLINQEFNVRKFISLWSQVAFYTILGFIFLILYKWVYLGESIIEIIKYGIPFLLPVSGGVYWFFSCYLLLYLMSPVLNQIKNLKKNYLFTLIIVCLCVFSVAVPVINILRGGDVFGVQDGKSLISFILLYLIGGVLRIHYPNITNLNIKWLILSGLAFIALLPLSRFITDGITERQTAFAEFLYVDTSFPALAASICFFLAGLSCHKKVIWCRTLASFTGDIYLAHENYAWFPLIWSVVDYPAHRNSLIIGGGYLVTTITVIFLSGMLIGIIRRWLFRRVKVFVMLLELLLKLTERMKGALEK